MRKVTIAKPKQIAAATNEVAAWFAFWPASSILKAELVPQPTIVGEGYDYSDPILEEGMWGQSTFWPS